MRGGIAEIVIITHEIASEKLGRAIDELALQPHLQAIHSVMPVLDGYTGLSLALSESFDVVILDWVLPGLDGLTICQQIKHSRIAKVILLTAKSSVNDRVYGLDQGADDYVVKPFSLRELEVRVRHLTLASRKGEQIIAPLTWALHQDRLG